MSAFLKRINNQIQIAPDKTEDKQINQYFTRKDIDMRLFHNKAW